MNRISKSAALIRAGLFGTVCLLALTVTFMGCDNLNLDSDIGSARSVMAGTATVTAANISGTIGSPLVTGSVTITLVGDTFRAKAGADATPWFTNLPAGLGASVDTITTSGTVATITVSGTPTAVSSFWIRGTIPANALTSFTPAVITPAVTGAYNITWTHTNWTHSATTPFTSGSVNAAAYGNGVFVLGNFNDGTVAVSTDGTSWIQASTGIIGYIKEIAFINGTFYAVGANGSLGTSIDGSTWTTPVTGLLNGNTVNSIAYGNGVYVIVGNGGQAAWTTDPSGSLWRAIDLQGFASNVNSVAFGGNIFIMVGQLGFSAFTTDPTAIWNITTNTTLAIFNNTTSSSQWGIKMVTYGNGTFVAVGFGTTAYTTNGTNWAGVSVQDITGLDAKTSWLNAVSYGGGYFVAGGGTGQSISSINGITWAVTGAQGQFTPSPPDGNMFINAITYGAGKYIIGGGYDGGPGIAAYNTN